MTQKELYESRYAAGIASGELAPYDDLSPEEKEAICVKCGAPVDPEMPFDVDEPVLCGGDFCWNERTDKE